MHHQLYLIRLTASVVLILHRRHVEVERSDVVLIEVERSDVVLVEVERSGVIEVERSVVVLVEVELSDVVLVEVERSGVVEVECRCRGRMQRHCARRGRT